MKNYLLNTLIPISLQVTRKVSSIYFGRRNSSGSSIQVEVIELENSLDLLNCNEFLNSNLELDDETSNGEKVGNNDNVSTFS